MKAYRKKLIGLALAAVFSFSPVSVFASSVNITSGLQIGGDEVECTFDSSRILYGEAKPGTDITFTVSKMDRFGNMVETHRAVSYTHLDVYKRQESSCIVTEWHRRRTIIPCPPSWHTTEVFCVRWKIMTARKAQQWHRDISNTRQNPFCVLSKINKTI